jgi:hypothetical protein
MILPPGGFFTLGLLLLGLAWWTGRSVLRPQPRRWPNQVVLGERVHAGHGGDA